MEEHSKDPLNILGQLAHEYQKKYEQLQEISRDTRPDMLAQKLGTQAELTTDRFRTAQFSLLSMLVSPSPDQEREKAFTTAVSLCRCFDEMRVLFQILMQNFSSGAE